jgi:hypothetical protein
VKVTAQQRELLTDRSAGFCEICYFAQATNWHHRKNRSQGGGNELSNAMHLCGSGTTGCHGMVTENPALAYENGWSVRSGHDPAEVPVLRHGSDLVLFDNQGGATSYKEGN